MAPNTNPTKLLTKVTSVALQRTSQQSKQLLPQDHLDTGNSSDHHNTSEIECFYLDELKRDIENNKGLNIKQLSYFFS